MDGKRGKVKPKDALEVSMAGHLKRILGVDLTTIPGLNVLAILTLISSFRELQNEGGLPAWAPDPRTPATPDS